MHAYEDVSNEEAVHIKTNVTHMLLHCSQTIVHDGSRKPV